jgi:NADH:ubiquinone oxidoreductase subunit F (NADH-binding)
MMKAKAHHLLLPKTAYDSYRAYLSDVGSSAIAKARSLSPTTLLLEIKDSGLLGRGGAGFPTGTKWETL